MGWGKARFREFGVASGQLGTVEGGGELVDGTLSCSLVSF